MNINKKALEYLITHEFIKFFSENGEELNFLDLMKAIEMIPKCGYMKIIKNDKAIYTKIDNNFIKNDNDKYKYKQKININNNLINRSVSV